MDIVEINELLRFDFFVNDVLMFSEAPPPYGERGPTREVEPRRQFGLDRRDKPNPGAYSTAYFYIDNVRAVNSIN